MAGVIGVLKEIILVAKRAKGELNRGATEEEEDRYDDEETLREKINLLGRKIGLALQVLVDEVKRRSSRERFVRCRNVICKLVADLLLLMGRIDDMKHRAKLRARLAEEQRREALAEEEFHREFAKVLHRDVERHNNNGTSTTTINIALSRTKRMSTDSQRFNRAAMERQQMVLQSVVDEASLSSHPHEDSSKETETKRKKRSRHRKKRQKNSTSKNRWKKAHYRVNNHNTDHQTAEEPEEQQEKEAEALHTNDEESEAAPAVRPRSNTDSFIEPDGQQKHRFWRKDTQTRPDRSMSLQEGPSTTEYHEAASTNRRRTEWCSIM